MLTSKLPLVIWIILSILTFAIVSVLEKIAGYKKSGKTKKYNKAGNIKREFSYEDYNFEMELTMRNRR